MSPSFKIFEVFKHLISFSKFMAQNLNYFCFSLLHIGLLLQSRNSRKLTATLININKIPEYFLVTELLRMRYFRIPKIWKIHRRSARNMQYYEFSICDR